MALNRDVRINVIVDLKQSEARVRDLENRSRRAGRGQVESTSAGATEAAILGGVLASSFATNRYGIEKAIDIAPILTGQRDAAFNRIKAALDGDPNLARAAITTLEQGPEGRTYYERSNIPRQRQVNFGEMELPGTGGQRSLRFHDVRMSPPLFRAWNFPWQTTPGEVRPSFFGGGSNVPIPPLRNGAVFTPGARWPDGGLMSQTPTRPGMVLASANFAYANSVSLAGMKRSYGLIKKIAKPVGLILPIVGVMAVIKGIRLLSDAKKQQMEDNAAGIGNGASINHYVQGAVDESVGSMGESFSNGAEAMVNASGVLAEMAESALGKQWNWMVPSSQGQYTRAQTGKRQIENYFNVNEAKAHAAARAFATESRKWNDAFQMALEAADKQSYEVSLDVATRLKQKGFSGSTSSLAFVIDDRIESLLKERVAEEFDKTRIKVTRTTGLRGR